jgi:tRNA A-37 threonylcarbamoyl transferase component Bud32
MELLASGRDADVYDLGDGTVLRRYKRRHVPAHEVMAMRYARASGFPVPAVISSSGPDLVLERVHGPTMQRVLEDGASLEANAATLAALHHRLHEISAPPGLPQRGDGDRLLHLDLHPANVILGPAGPVVIDWANAASGPAALDPALAIAIFVTAKAGAEPGREVIDVFIRAFASHFDRRELVAAMPLAISLRAADPNVTEAERRELAGLERLPIP